MEILAGLRCFLKLQRRYCLIDDMNRDERGTACRRYNPHIITSIIKEIALSCLDSQLSNASLSVRHILFTVKYETRIDCVLLLIVFNQFQFADAVKPLFFLICIIVKQNGNGCFSIFWKNRIRRIARMSLFLLIQVISSLFRRNAGISVFIVIGQIIVPISNRLMRQNLLRQIAVVFLIYSIFLALIAQNHRLFLCRIFLAADGYFARCAEKRQFCHTSVICDRS